MTYTLLFATLVFVVVGLAGGETSNLEPLFAGDAVRGAMVGVLAVFATTPFWFAGFDTIPQAMGEVRKGAQLRLIPRVMLLAILTALAFYCLVILTAALSLPRIELLALELPVAGALEAAFNSVFLGKLVLFAGLCGLITTWNTLFFASTRLVFALGRGHMIPRIFARVHPEYGSSFVAVLLVGIIGTIGALFGRNAILPIVNASSACLAFVFLLVVLGVARLRRTRPDHERPYRVPGGFFLPYLAGVFSLGLLAISLYEPYRAAGGEIPVEWMALGTWAVLGAVFWQAAAKMRREVTEEDRHWLILGERESG